MTEDYQNHARAPPAKAVESSRSGPHPLPHQGNKFVLPGCRRFRAWKNHLAAVLPDHFQKPTPFRRIKRKVILDGLRAAVKNQLHVMQGPQVIGDPVNRFETEAGCPPLNALRDCVIRVEDGQPEALNHRLQRVVQ